MDFVQVDKFWMGKYPVTKLQYDQLVQASRKPGATFSLHARDKDELLWLLIANMIHATEDEVAQKFGGIIPLQAEYYVYRNIFVHIEQNRDIYRVILGSRGSSQMSHRVMNIWSLKP